MSLGFSLNSEILPERRQIELDDFAGIRRKIKCRGKKNNLEHGWKSSLPTKPGILSTVAPERGSV